MSLESESNALRAEQAETPSGDFRYIVRQPVLSARGDVFGYELLFCDGADRVTLASNHQAFRSLLDNTVLFGLERLSSGLPAFVRCTPESLTEEGMQLLPPGLAVPELRADVQVDEELLGQCRRLKGSGYRIALEDFSGADDSSALLELADYVKVDIARFDSEELDRVLSSLSSYHGPIIATNVQTQSQYQKILSRGFSYFQGYFFCRPEMVENARIPANRMVHLEILELIQQQPFDLNRLSQLVGCDASLTYRLLRLVNSPLCAMRQEVTSIQSALMLIGERTFRHLAMLAITSDFSEGQVNEVLRMAFERARFCELAAELCGLIAPEQYLIGMVSMFPAMLRIPLTSIVSALPLRENARLALLGEPVREGILLQWLLHQEDEEWGACEAILRTFNLRGDQVMRIRAEAIAWADTALYASSGKY